MKLLILAVCVTVAAAWGDWSGFPRKRSIERRATTANANDYTDALLTQISKFVAENYDPAPLPQAFLYDLPLKDPVTHLTWNTRAGFYNGNVSDISTIHRVGDAIVSYKNLTNLNIVAGVQFSKLTLNYNWDAKVLSFGPRGSFSSVVKNAGGDIDVTINLRKLKVTINSFKLDEPKSIKTKVKGFTIFGNWAVDAFIDFIANVFVKGPVFKLVNDKINEILPLAADSVVLPSDS